MAYAEKRGKTWRVKYKRPDGKEGSESGFATKSAALAFGRAQEAQIRRAEWIDPKGARTTLAEFWEPFMAATSAALATRARYESHWRRHIKPKWGHVRLGDIATAHIEIRAWKNSLLEQGLAETTVASILQTFSAMMDMAEEARLILVSPCRKIKTGLGYVPQRPRLVAAPVQVLRAAMRLHQVRQRGFTDFVLCLVAFYAGTRWGEAVGQTRDEYDRVNKAIWVVEPLKEVGGHLSKGGRPLTAPPVETREKRPRSAREGGTKTPASTRWIHLPDWLAELYEELMASHQQRFVFVGARGKALRGPRYHAVWRRVWDGDPDHRDPALRPPILPGMTFHEARHTLRTWLAEDGIPEIARVGRLGHKMPGMGSVYEHVTPTMIRRMLRALTRRWHQSIRDLDPAERELLIELVPSLKGEVEKAMSARRGSGGQSRASSETISHISPMRLARS